MGREVRRVPANWDHPRDEQGNFIPLEKGYQADSDGFLSRVVEHGLQDAIEYYGQAPDINKYMPEWDEPEKTHYMMYENVSEGTPISPAFATPEELACWLADHNASAFGSIGASYEAWLRVCRGGYAPSMVFSSQGMQSGVEALKDDQ